MTQCCLTWCAVIAVTSSAAWFSCLAAPAAEARPAGGASAMSPRSDAEQSSAGGVEQSPSPAKLERFREDFVKNFKRLPLNTAPGDAAFLRIMVEICGAKRGVEVGTATGYGAILMGWGFERNGGHLTTIEIDPEMARKARQNIAKMRLKKSVTLVEGDALKVLPKLEGRFDLVFLDAVKRDYLKYFRAVEPKLEPGSVIVADNAIRLANQMRDFLDAMRQDPRYRMVIIRASDLKNDGMAVIYKLR